MLEYNPVINAVDREIHKKFANFDNLHRIHRIDLKLAFVAKLMTHGLKMMAGDTAKYGAAHAKERHQHILTAYDEYSDKLIAERRTLAADGKYPPGVPELKPEMLQGA